MQNEEYNGWTNRETWATALHIDNEPFTYEHRLFLMAEAIRQGKEHTFEGGYLTPEESARYRLADALQEWVEAEIGAVYHDHENALERSRMMASDVGSLWRVNWNEIAANFLSEEHDDLEALG